MISHFFIDRPIFASVLSIVITLTGAVSLIWLPLAQYPQITPPAVTVSCSYPGASAPGVAHTVGISGQSLILGANAPNLGSMYVMLDRFEDRDSPGLSADAIARELSERCRAVRGAQVAVFGAPPIEGLGTTGGYRLMSRTAATWEWPRCSASATGSWTGAT
jgi:multidrug efflux pump subunit AcrB